VDVERSNAAGLRKSSMKVVKQEDLSADKVFELLQVRYDGDGADELEEETDEEMPVMGPDEANALGLHHVIPAKDKAALKEYGLPKDKFVELFHQYRFQGELLNSVVNLRSKDLHKRSEGVHTTCTGSKYCLCPEDLINLGLEPADVAQESEEFRRFGKLTMEKKVGFMNTAALIRAMAKRRDRKLSYKETQQVSEPSNAMDRLQMQANALDILAKPVEHKGEQGFAVELAPPGAPSFIRSNGVVYHERSKKGNVGAVAVLRNGNETEGWRMVFRPASESRLWLEFMQSARKMAPAHLAPASALDEYDPESTTIHPKESVLRAAMVSITNLSDNKKGKGYATVVRHEESGRVRILMRGVIKTEG